MSKTTLLIVGSSIFTLLFISGARAATYKCIDENGGVTYSQSPCQQNQTTDKLLNNSKESAEIEDCRFAGAFSQVAFRYMRSGLSSQQLFERFGGRHSISQSTLGVINYVYSFKYSTAMQPDRVAELTIARCKAQAFGNVLCEDFPQEFQEIIFSCDDEEREEALRLQNLVDQSREPEMQLNDFTSTDTYGAKDREARNQELKKSWEKKQREREQARIAKCKKRYESQIERIDDRMRQGYSASQGEAMRDRRRSLVKKLAKDCE